MAYTCDNYEAMKMGFRLNKFSLNAAFYMEAHMCAHVHVHVCAYVFLCAYVVCTCECVHMDVCMYT